VSPDPAFTLNPVDGAGNPVNLAVLALQRWVGTGGVTGRYLRVGDPGFPALGPGQGFWVRPTSLTTLSPRGSLVDQTKPFSVPLAEGWNMFGSVFIGDINWSAVKVRFQGVEYPIAAAGQIVRSNAWGYDRAARSYRIITSADVVRAGRGYWIRALQACELVLAPPGTRAAPGRDADMKTKSLQIVAKIANRSDLDNFAPLTGLDKTRIAELEKPAYIADYVTVRFLSADAVQLPEGTRAPAGATTLAFEVETDRPNADVSVVFPTVATLGRKNEMTLVDLSTGTRRALGSIAGYSYNSGENVAPRRFAVIVSQRKANTSLLISSVRSTGRSGGALSFSFDLSHGASVRAQIVAGGGRVIRDIAQGRAATEGVNTLLWDGRDARGASVPAGSYLLKLSATDEVGRAASAVLPVTVVR
jgi:hypothetical protein